MSRGGHCVVVTTWRRLWPSRCNPAWLISVNFYAGLPVFADVHGTSLSGEIAFGEVHAVGYAYIAEIFVILHHRQTGVVVALASVSSKRVSSMRALLTEK